MWVITSPSFSWSASFHSSKPFKWLFAHLAIILGTQTLKNLAFNGGGSIKTIEGFEVQLSDLGGIPMAGILPGNDDLDALEDEFVQEVAILKLVHHKVIVLVISVCTKFAHLSIVIECMLGGGL